MKTRLTHVRANVSDLHRAIEWYQNILGFETNTIYPSKNPVYADFQIYGGACFSIMINKNVPSHGRFNFEVEDVDAFWERIKDRVEVVEPLVDTPYGTRKFTIKDPDGNELGFVQCPK